MIKFLNKITYKHLFVFLVSALIIEFIILRNLPFFWDGISKSVRANWIYNNNLNSFIVPTTINSGHPPLWIYTLAIFWKVLGQTLISSRFLLLLVNIGVVYQIIILCKNNFVKAVLIVSVLLVCLEPTFIAQTTSLNNDMLLLFFTLLAFNSIVSSKQWLLLIALTGLLLTNLRGIYIFIAIIIIHTLYLKFNLIKNNKKLFLSYIIATCVFAIFCIFQYKTLGWFIITQSIIYSPQRQSVGIELILLNFAVYIKSFLEYGRFIIFILLVPLLIEYLKNNSLKNKKINRLLIAFMVFFLIFFIGMVPFSNPIGSRYFMVCYILSIVLFINLLYHLKKSKRYRQLSTLTVTLFLLSGHLWIYPATISQAWDSSLAYLNYFEIEKNMEHYIDSISIDHQDIGTRIRLNSRGYSTLRMLPKESLYANFNMNVNQYILYSNIENYTKDEELLYIQNNWVLVKTFNNMGVFISLYKNPDL